MTLWSAKEQKGPDCHCMRLEHVISFVFLSLSTHLGGEIIMIKKKFVL